MAKVIVALALALVCAQDRPGQEKPGQPGQDKPGTERGAQDLDQALTKASQMNNYTANITVRKDGMSDPSREPGGREPGGRDIQPIEVRVMPNLPVYIKSGELEGYRKDNVFILKEGATWKKVEGDMPKGGEKGEISGHKLAMIRAPHEVLRNLKSSSFKSVRREDSEGGRVFSGELNEAALRQILADKKGGDISQATGNAKIWLGRDGGVSKMELVIDRKAAPGKTDAEGGKITKTIEFRDVNSTKYEVPADATKQFGATDRTDKTDKTDKSDKDRTDKDQPEKDKPEDKPMDEPKKEDPKY